MNADVVATPDTATPDTATADTATFAGLLRSGRPHLVRVIALYAALTIVLLAIPALLAQPRSESSHLSQQDVRTTPVEDVQATPGRAP